MRRIRTRSVWHQNSRQRSGEGFSSRRYGSRVRHHRWIGFTGATVLTFVIHLAAVLHCSAGCTTSKRRHKRSAIMFTAQVDLTKASLDLARRFDHDSASMPIAPAVCMKPKPPWCKCSLLGQNSDLRTGSCASMWSHCFRRARRTTQRKAMMQLIHPSTSHVNGRSLERVRGGAAAAEHWPARISWLRASTTCSRGVKGSSQGTWSMEASFCHGFYAKLLEERQALRGLHTIRVRV